MLNIIIQTVILLVLTLLIVSIFDKLDTDVNIAFNRRDILGLAVISLFCSITINKLSNLGFTEYILLFGITSMLLVMTYTDLKLMEVYLVVNVINLLFCIIYFIYNIDGFHANMANLSQIKMLISVIIILIVLSMTQGVGLGDTLIYFGLLLVYSVHTRFGIILLVLNILISNALFVITNSFKFLKDKKQKLPLIPYILAAWLLLIKAM